MKKGISFLDIEMENCEPSAEFEARISSFFRELIEILKESKEEQETVLVAAHGLTNQRLMIMLNTKPKFVGVDKWQPNKISERQMRNTTYHKLVLEIGEKEVTGFVEQAHCRDHIETSNNGTPLANGDKVPEDKVKDSKNYSFLEQADRTFAEETAHYCQPV